MGTVSADQLAILLKSIEDKYTALQDENARLLARLEGRRDDRDELHAKVASQQREIEALQRALVAHTEAETAAETAAALVTPPDGTLAPPPELAPDLRLAWDTEEDEPDEPAAARGEERSGV
ncbi:MAG: hypothetical protein VKS61_09070 [Candidatus Sericytochromatia bacterium]|nr:hypothetical protein [Candidatus Sericytochromatia bacterium]